MIPPYTYAVARLAEERMQDTMRDGELARLIRSAKPAKFGFKEWAIATLGEQLKALGERLQERYLPTQPELHQQALRGNR